MEKKCQFWNARSLSRVGKEVLIKSVAQAIPSYCMGAFLIPTSLCEELERMMNSLYWGSLKNGRCGINWMRWDKLTLHKSLGGLGFCNMEAFTLSMMGKQSWKLLTDSTSLLTRILKAKYFPRRDFLDASLGHNPSYTWRSLWSTQSLLTLGHRWKIGDGTKINFWNMSWIRSLPSLKPSTIPPPHYKDLTVSHLLNSGMNSWNQMIVQSIFNHSDASAILATPFYSRTMEDTRIWKASINGSYSVKTAYRICMDLLLEATPSHGNYNWTSHWNLKIPPRVLSFLWRLAHQCLPTRANLTTRGIPCEDSCVSCELLAETHMHAFFVCSKAANCWEKIGLGNLICNLLLTADNFTATLFNLFDKLSLHHQHLAVMLLWSLWKSHNAKLWEATDTSPNFIISHAKGTLQKWSCMQRTKHQEQNLTHTSSWVKPPTGTTKCNVDAAMFDNNTIMRYGMYFRNSLGQLFLGKSGFLLSFATVLEAGSIALLESIKTAISNGMHTVLFETDCKSLVDALTSPTIPISEFDNLVS